MTEKENPGGTATKEPPADKKQNSQEDRLAEAKKNQENIGPDSPRFKEVYGKMKEHERVLSEKEKDLEAMREHMRKMEGELAKVKERQDERPLPSEPDKELEPDAHKAWVKLKQAHDERDREKRDMEKEVQLAIRMTSARYDDYEDMVKVAQKEMDRDPELRKKVWADPVQAPERAYKLGKKVTEEKAKKVENDEKERQKLIENGDLLGDGGEGGGEDEIRLTEQQKRVVRNLYPDLDYKEAEKRYVKSMKSLGMGGQ